MSVDQNGNVITFSIERLKYFADGFHHVSMNPKQVFHRQIQLHCGKRLFALHGLLCDGDLSVFSAALILGGTGAEKMNEG